MEVVFLLSGVITWPEGFSEVKEHLLLPSSAEIASLAILKLTTIEFNINNKKYILSNLCKNNTMYKYV